MKIEADKVIAVVREAATLFFDQNKVSHVAVKGYGNYVTEADKAVQAFIQRRLREEYPAIQFFAEEKENGDVDITGDFWILDPIDGTLNLMHDFGHSAISLGYAEAGKLTFGLIYDPYRDEMFRAQTGHGAFMMQHVSQSLPEELHVSNIIDRNASSDAAGSRYGNSYTPNHGSFWFPIHVSSSHSLSESVVLIGTAPYERARLGSQYADVIHQVFMHSQDIRRFGAAVLDLAWVACGRADAYFEHVYPWDRAAGSVLVQEAGGKVCSFDGTDVPVTSFHDICAGTPGAVDEIVSITKPVFSDGIFFY